MDQIQNAQKPVIVVPKTLTWDKLTALYLYIRFVLNRAFEDVVVRFEDEFTNIAAIPAEYPDIDVRTKYNRDGKFGSATERVANETKLTEELFPGQEYLKGLSRLIVLLNANNKTGGLKNAPQSLVALIRQMYEVNHNVEQYTYRRQVIELFLPVLDAYFSAYSRDASSMNDIANPFTLDNYWLMRVMGGNQDEDHFEEIKRAFEKAATREAQAADRAQTAQAKKFDIIKFEKLLEKVEGHLLESDDQRLAREYMQLHPEAAMVVVRKSSGHYAILVRGRQDMSALATVLELKEPGRWFYDTRPQSPLLLNGSSSRAAEASSLKPLELVSLIQLNYRHRSRSQQEQVKR